MKYLSNEQTVLARYGFKNIGSSLEDGGEIDVYQREEYTVVYISKKKCEHWIVFKNSIPQVITENLGTAINILKAAGA